ncbi:TniQ family protein [Bacillus thuringiensis]|uniref:TniQ family protein n=1 Tax=Bacillus thuringiensis TaxID=1428 RepID=UPI0034578099
MLSFWDFKEIRTPERSLCYSLEPISINSIDVESLTSYIHRLAEVHSISVSSLMRHLIFPTIYKDKDKDHSYSENALYRVYYKSYSINGFNKYAELISQALIRLTSMKELERLTCLKLRSLLTADDIKVFRHWCPACIYEQQKEKFTYEKLIWSIKSVTICLKHNCHLESICPNCKNKMKQLDLQSVIGYCPKCKEWLGSDSVIGNNTCGENILWQNWVYGNIEDLIKSETNKFINREFVSNKLSNFLNGHFRRTNNTLRNLAENMNYNRCTLSQWKRKAKKISFESLLILSYCVEMPIKEILFESDTIKIKNVRKIKDDLIMKKSYITRTASEKMDLLHKFINSDEYPPLKLSEVTKQMGYSSNESLRAHFPEECNLISTRYKEYKSKNNAEKNFIAKNAIKECVITALQEGRILNNSYIQSKVKIGRRFANVEIRKYVEEILKNNT